MYFLVTGITGLQLLGVENFVQQLFYGGALVIAVTLSHARAPAGGSKERLALGLRRTGARSYARHALAAALPTGASTEEWDDQG